MQPVVPKVQVGDILYGTRNLRNWLQAASLHCCVDNITHGLREKEAKRYLYIPSKDNQHVVIVNSGLAFMVWIKGSNIILPFMNPHPSQSPKRSAKAEPSTGARKMWTDLPTPKGSAGLAIRPKSPEPQKGHALMSPALFSTWFIRSQEKMPNLHTWPDAAYLYWVQLQMDTLGNGADHRPSFRPITSHDRVFEPSLPPTRSDRKLDRDRLKSYVVRAISTGGTRGQIQRRWTQSGTSSLGYGPRIEDLRFFRDAIEGNIRNPRVGRKAAAAGVSNLIRKIVEINIPPR